MERPFLRSKLERRREYRRLERPSRKQLGLSPNERRIHSWTKLARRVFGNYLHKKSLYRAPTGHGGSLRVSGTANIMSCTDGRRRTEQSGHCAYISQSS